MQLYPRFLQVSGHVLVAVVTRVITEHVYGFTWLGFFNFLKEGYGSLCVQSGILPNYELMRRQVYPARNVEALAPAIRGDLLRGVYGNLKLRTNAA